MFGTFDFIILIAEICNVIKHSDYLLFADDVKRSMPYIPLKIAFCYSLMNIDYCCTAEYTEHIQCCRTDNCTEHTEYCCTADCTEHTQYCCTGNYTEHIEYCCTADCTECIE